MNVRKLLKPLGVTTFLFFINLSLLSNVYSQDTILFVSDRDAPANWDIYSMNVDGSSVTRLTDSPSIDNHPALSHDGTTVVFSSDLPGGNFEIYKAPLATLADETTWVQLTSFGCANAINPIRCTPARHPEWSPDDSEIIYTAKDGCCDKEEIVVSQCSVPIPTNTQQCPNGEHYERIHIMNADGTNDRVIDPVTLQGGNCDTPTIFHAGHPQFHPNGDKIIFSGATNRDGTDWEVFIVDWNGTLASNLRQVTLGTVFPPNPNPIKMTGGARFSNDGNDIYFSSIRTWKGNSQLFVIRNWASQVLPLPVSNDLRLTWHCGNDYVPEQLPSGYIVYTSDAAVPWNNPQDLDIWGVNPDGSGRTNLTNNPNCAEMTLIADEVSWFCGLPRNLSPCIFILRAIAIESKHIMLQSFQWMPLNFPNRELYPHYMDALSDYLERNRPNLLSNIQVWLSQFVSAADNDLDGLTNEDPQNGKDDDGDGQTDEDHPTGDEIEIIAATRQIVVPVVMPPVELWCPDCIPCDTCVLIQTTSPLPDAVFNQPYSAILQADTVVQRWSAFAGRLPDGLDLDPNTGEISGIPTEIVSLQLASIAAIDVNGNADSKDFTITVNPGAATTTSTTTTIATTSTTTTTTTPTSTTTTTTVVCQCTADTVAPVGCISGQVTDRAGNPLSGKTVKLKRKRPRPRIKLTAITDSNGCYIFTDLEDGRYKTKAKGRPCRGRAGRQRVDISGGDKRNNVNLQCRR